MSSVTSCGATKAPVRSVIVTTETLDRNETARTGYFEKVGCRQIVNVKLTVKWNYATAFAAMTKLSKSVWQLSDFILQNSALQLCNTGNSFRFSRELAKG